MDVPVKWFSFELFSLHWCFMTVTYSSLPQELCNDYYSTNSFIDIYFNSSKNVDNKF